MFKLINTSFVFASLAAAKKVACSYQLADLPMVLLDDFGDEVHIIPKVEGSPAPRPPEEMIHRHMYKNRRPLCCPSHFESPDDPGDCDEDTIFGPTSC